MELSLQSLKNREKWEEAGFVLPSYDIEKMAAATKAAPEWLHLGAGNIFRAFTANLQQTLLDRGIANKGIIVAEGFDYEIIEKMYQPNDNLSILVTLKSDGTIDKSVIGSIAESITMNEEDEKNWKRLIEIFTAPSLKMISFTITEKGYNLQSQDGTYFPNVSADLENGPDHVSSYIGKLCSLLYQRFLAGRLPVALVSMDNCSHNGTRLFQAVDTYAKAWTLQGLVKPEFTDYIHDPASVSFTWSMIDKITPRPDDTVKEMLKSSGFTAAEPVVTSKNTYVAPFVNAEEAQYLVIEDAFPNGRPALDKAGVIFTDRETVDKVEKMKVCTCLNPLHTALAVFGCLLGYDLIADEMKDTELKRLVEIIGFQEGLPVVTDPGILSPKAFIDEVLTRRIPNPFMPDTPQRIATDTSQKLSIRFGETIKAYADSPDKNISDLKLIPLVLAGWCRYLLAVDDKGTPFTPSPDPLLESSREYVKDIRLGNAENDCHKALKPLLSNPVIFGVDLYDVGLGETVEKYFSELTAGTGAVRQTLKRHVGDSGENI